MRKSWFFFLVSFFIAIDPGFLFFFLSSQLEGIPDLVSEQGMRKGLYQKVIMNLPIMNNDL